MKVKKKLTKLLVPDSLEKLYALHSCLQSSAQDLRELNVCYMKGLQ